MPGTTHTPRPQPRTLLLRRRADLAQGLLELLAVDIDGPYTHTERQVLEQACEALISALCATEHNRPPSGNDARRIRRVIDLAQARPGKGDGWLDLLIGYVMTVEDTDRHPGLIRLDTGTPGPERAHPLHDAATEALLIAQHVDGYTAHKLVTAATTLVARVFNTDPRTAHAVVERARYTLGHGTADDDWLDASAAFVTGPGLPPMPEAALAWVSAGTSEPGDQHAESRWVDDHADSARYEVGPAYAAPGPDGQRWAAALTQLDVDGRALDSIHFGVFEDEEAAKQRALAYERNGTVPQP